MAKFIHVVLRLPKPVQRLFIYAQIVLKALTGNASFASIDLTKLQMRIQALGKAETAAGNHEPGSAAAYAAAREAVKEELERLRGLVQVVLETQPNTADLKAIQAMVESAAMGLRKVSVRPKQVFAVMYGGQPGGVKLTAPASRTRDTHEWEHSADQLTWTALPATRQARTAATGLPVGVVRYFRHRLLTKSGYTPWSDPTIMFVIK